ncbi:hypothetical protein A2V71_03935 [Candidatus Berkelbacteria bacterium RBG_13_40_8]|uniref:Uncharacterized protein n=1 Tax=Candidatus Berkelbacteria bacterium RBG_13_40_8 TaxID=1797467 RepID=A0A1F5DLK3_9BACT|nr:MAG: hypothetical protein A2V71_03935 [Candidatus Berkelbacteria bacterium RBG_13_40_8]
MPIFGQKPVPLKLNFKQRPFAGERCPLCQKNRLTVAHQYPICTQCRKIFSNNEKILKELAGHEIIFDKDEIDWKEKPCPTISGSYDTKRWQGSFSLQKWSVTRSEDFSQEEALLVRQILELLTPSFIDRQKKRKTKIRRRIFFIALGATVATAAYLAKKHSDLKNKEDTIE